MELRSFLIALMAVLVSTMARDVSAAGCGEPVSANATCDDWQCTRQVMALTVSNISNSSTNQTYCVRGVAEGMPCATTDDCYAELTCRNGTCVKEGKIALAWRGYIAISIAVVCFGSNFIPVKRQATGNGLYFQFCMSIAILIVGIGVQLYRGAPFIYPYSMLGGMCWALGNTLAVPVIQLLGMGLAVTTWGCSNLVLGWTSGKVGFLGLKKEAFEIEWMSYASVGVACVAIVFFGLVSPSATPSATDDDDSRSKRTTSRRRNNTRDDEDDFRKQLWPPLNDEVDDDAPTMIESLPLGLRRVLGVVGALCAGALFSFNFTPSMSLISNYAEKSLDGPVKYSPNGLDYVFSTNLGIFLTTSSLFFLFSATQRWLPRMFPDIDHGTLFAPAFLSGLMWAAANTAWFVANTDLGMVVSFPIICLGPSLIANFWGIVLFSEISGARNFVVLALAFACLSVSIFFTVYGKQA